MKTHVALLLAAVLLLSLTACSTPTAEPTEPAGYQTAVKLSAVITKGEEKLNVEYVYKDGDLIKEVFTAADGTSYSNFYIFNDEGYCTSAVMNNADGSKDKYRHTVDAEGVLTKSVHTTPTGSKNTKVYTYGEDGVCTGYTLTYASKDVQEAVYTYNTLGAIEKMEITGFEPSTTVYEYDQFGSVVKETVTAGGTETVTTYEYTYQQ